MQGGIKKQVKEVQQDWPLSSIPAQMDLHNPLH